MQNLHLDTLPAILVLIASAVLIVICFRKINLSPVLGYLFAGILVGDYGFKIIPSEKTTFIAEFGIVFLLFAIGLELSFERLKDMRKYVFGLGSLQILATFSVFCLILHFLFQLDYHVSIIIAGGIALSSTAVVLQVIRDSHKQSTHFGRISLAILIQQDLFVMPLIVLVPILASNAGGKVILTEVSLATLKALLALSLIFLIGRIFLRPLFKTISIISPSNNSELFVAATLLIVLTSAWLTEYLGLSLALGAFVSGVLVAETEFRHQAETSILPFKDILLGLFFMSVGMTIDINLFMHKYFMVLAYTGGVIIIKFIIVAGSCYLFKLNKILSLQTGIILSQVGEFSLVLCKISMQDSLISPAIGAMCLVVITASMAFTPLLSSFGDYLSRKLCNIDINPLENIQANAKDLTDHIIIVGLTPSSKMSADMFAVNNIAHIIIERKDQSVETGKESGLPIFFGNGDDIETLKAAGVANARGVLLSGVNGILRSIKIISTNFPKIPIIVYSNNANNTKKLYDLGAHVVVPASCEAGLELASVFLRDHGLSPVEVSRIKNLYRSNAYNQISKDSVGVENT